MNEVGVWLRSGSLLGSSRRWGGSVVIWVFMSTVDKTHECCEDKGIPGWDLCPVAAVAAAIPGAVLSFVPTINRGTTSVECDMMWFVLGLWPQWMCMLRISRRRQASTAEVEVIGV